MERKTKARVHKKRTKNPTTNYPKDTHKEFCVRCHRYNDGCPDFRNMHRCIL